MDNSKNKKWIVLLILTIISFVISIMFLILLIVPPNNYFVTAVKATNNEIVEYFDYNEKNDIKVTLRSYDNRRFYVVIYCTTNQDRFDLSLCEGHISGSSYRNASGYDWFSFEYNANLNEFGIIAATDIELAQNVYNIIESSANIVFTKYFVTYNNRVITLKDVMIDSLAFERTRIISFIFHFTFLALFITLSIILLHYRKLNKKQIRDE